jgi:hypothetical protein
LDAYTADNLLVGNARLVFQEEVMFEQGEARMDGEKGLTQMDEDRDLED